MPETITKTIRMDVGTDTGQTLFSATGASMDRTTITVPGAKGGSLTGRTDNDTGVATLANGHGLVTSDVVDVFWAGGSRRGMAATVTGNAVTVDGGSGDNLPVLTTAVAVMKPVVVTVGVAGDDAVGVAVYGAQGGYVAFRTSAPADIKVYKLPAGAADGWVSGDGGSNPLAGQAVGKIAFSHGSTEAAVMWSRVAYGTPP